MNMMIFLEALVRLTAFSDLDRHTLLKGGAISLDIGTLEDCVAIAGVIENRACEEIARAVENSPWFSAEAKKVGGIIAYDIAARAKPERRNG